MATELLPFLHIAPWIRGRGGVETLLKLHRAGDRDHGLASSELALFDRPTAEASDRYQTLSFSWRSTPVGMRSAFRRALSNHSGKAMVYHNAWGLPWFADVDGASRRLVFLHTNAADFGPWLPALSPWIDGVVCVNPLAAEAAMRLMPERDPARFFSVTLPISPVIPACSQRAKGNELVLGYAGRLVRAQKRSKRLVAFVAELKRLGLTFRLEVVGDGPLRSRLEKALAHESGVKFFGWLEGENLWGRMRGWDASLSFSEMEGGPILLVEAMQSGALPIYPAIGGTLGDLYGPQIDARCLYPHGDIPAAARALKDLFSSPPDQLALAREKAVEVARRHQQVAYPAEFAAFAHRIAAWPRISQESLRQRSARWTDTLPLGVITRSFQSALWR